MAARHKILIVDDEPEVTETLETALQTWGYAVVTAKDGEEGLTKAKQEAPDLVIADLRLPKLDGWSLCHQLRQDRRYQRTPFIILSGLIEGDADNESAKDAYGQLGYVYLEKPIRIEKLSAALKTLLAAPARSAG